MNRLCLFFCALMLVSPYLAKGLPDERSRFETLMNLAEQMSKIDHTQALENAEKALAISEKLQNPKMIAQAQNMLATLCYAGQNFTKSIEYGILCESYFQKSGDVETLSNLYKTLSTANFYIGNAEMSNIYSDKCIELAEKHHFVDILFKQYYNRGIMAFYRGDYSSSMEFALKALNIAKNNNSISFTAKCYDLLGSISNNISEHRKAINYFELSLNIYLAEDDKLFVGQTYNNLAFTYGKINRQDSVRLCYYKALDYYRETESAEGLSFTYTGLADYYQSEGKLDSAQIFIEKGLKEALLSESTLNLFNSYNTAGNIFFLQGDYPKALEYQRRALVLAQRIRNKEQESIARYGISRNFAVMQRYDSAYHYLSQSYAINDSLQRNDEIQKRAFAFAEHLVKEKFEKELEAEKLQRRLWLAIMSLCGMLIVILSVFILSMSVRQKKIKSINAELNKYKLELENNLQNRTRELRLTEQQILNLSNNLPSGVIFRFAFENEREGKLVYASTGWEELTGQSLKMVNDAVSFFQNRIHPDDSREMLHALAHAIQNHTILDKVYRFYKNNTNMRWFHVRAIAIAGDDGLTYLDGFQVDETEQKFFEQELVTAKNKAEESDRLKSAFLANMSHEIRTPMNAIVGFSTLLVNKKLPPHRQNSYLELIRDNCQNLLHLIDDIVDISKIEAGQLNLRMETIPLSDIMKAVKGHFDPFVALGHPHVELWIDEGLLNSSMTIHTDLFRMKQIFVNLIENALKFTQKGFVRCAQLFDRNDVLHFIIMDTGIGIAHEDVENIFQSFRKLDHYSTGTGLGLSIVRRALVQMGGNIWVESEPDVGSTFHFTLPLNK